MRCLESGHQSITCVWPANLSFNNLIFQALIFRNVYETWFRTPAWWKQPAHLFVFLLTQTTQVIYNYLYWWDIFQLHKFYIIDDVPYTVEPGKGPQSPSLCEPPKSWQEILSYDVLLVTIEIHHSSQVLPSLKVHLYWQFVDLLIHCVALFFIITVKPHLGATSV